ncbi:MAG: molybdopterin molybdenumtransferase MoeA [Planctomycetota bacterium]|nr:MAG: molybdopterin molybdenumtransferase MoeA [Planctomycetota bacterium]REJ97124.1 MAG: molybdopterin molybdenumtransferase MoeA [Planctomycetota bacterium]REK27933.1 MAG: molybdopterin molybdenumtransferase MoeA [Planctomycetota bacterium]REK42263.1 MAG: molybdopterin molybdenumtransferase MoeA [Planctomycetota bacterium]
MITVSAALAKVLEHAQAKLPERVLLREAAGQVLAEDVASDVDSPPHDKSLVDGYAVRATDIERALSGRASEPIELAVVEEVTAGDVPKHELRAGQATRIMTGAPLPAGAEAVVMVEETAWQAEAGQPLGVVRIETERFTAGQNIMRRGAAMRAGQVVLETGHIVREMEVGLLAEVGRAEVQVVPRPRVAVLPTGNELVDAATVPPPGKIRNSNGPMLLAAVARAGGWGVDLGVGRDEEATLRELISQGLANDVLILSGGVSAGVLDLVPKVLGELGVVEVFHKVSLKPGKPLWFGVAEASRGSAEGDAVSPQPKTLVFGLPGNPVSSLVCFHLFVAPAMAVLAGRPQPAAREVTATLTAPFEHRGDRPTYHPARLEPAATTTETDVAAAAAVREAESATVTPLDWRGSSDLRTLVAANALILFAPGERRYAVGERVACRPL